MKNKHIIYLCLQATREGQASYAHVHEIIKGLRKRGWKVDLYEPAYARDAMEPGALERAWQFFVVQARLSVALRMTGAVDAIYIRSHFATLPVAAVAKLFRIPVIQEVNGSYEDLFLAWPWTQRFGMIFKWMTRKQLAWADRIITVTPGLRDWIRSETGHSHVYVIPNGANTDMFSPDVPMDTELHDPYVVFVGALAPWQGIDTMIAAAMRPEWPAGIKLVIVGDGIGKLDVQTAAVANKNIVYLGKVSYDRVPGILTGSVAALSTQTGDTRHSLFGVYPLKLFEAMASGIPVICTDYPGQADLVRQHRCGIVVSPKDPKELADAVAVLFANPAIRQEMGQRGCAAARMTCSWDMRASETERVLISIWGNS